METGGIVFPMGKQIEASSEYISKKFSLPLLFEFVNSKFVYPTQRPQRKRFEGPQTNALCKVGKTLYKVNIFLVFSFGRIEYSANSSLLFVS